MVSTTTGEDRVPVSGLLGSHSSPEASAAAARSLVLQGGFQTLKVKVTVPLQSGEASQKEASSK
jgi:L-alanine-DL-glutamate epimerase-like enolase superfamily enzyme